MIGDARLCGRDKAIPGLRAFCAEYQKRRSQGRGRHYSLDLACYAAWCAVRVIPTEGHWLQYTPRFWYSLWRFVQKCAA